VNRSPHNTAACLKGKIMEVMANLPRDTGAKACKRFRQRIEAEVEVGGYFSNNPLYTIPINITWKFD
jgi:hypothetical protein